MIKESHMFVFHALALKVIYIAHAANLYVEEHFNILCI